MKQIERDMEIMRAAGINDGEVVRLAWLKQRVEHGECDELTLEYKRLTFGKFLFDRGAISDKYPLTSSSPTTETFLNSPVSTIRAATTEVSEPHDYGG